MYTDLTMPPPFFYISLSLLIFLYTIKTDKEYQQRRLLDVLVAGVKIQFERYKEHSLVIKGSILKFRAWDPDMSKSVSDRNRHLLGHAEEESDPFFSFQYRTFRTLYNVHDKQSHLPDWIENKITSGDIDDFLTIKMRPSEFNYLSERTAELTDYLKHGLPGKGMGAIKSGTESFCASRIRTRSFLDLVIEQPCVFIPRSPISNVGGCFLSLGTVEVTSWFEEASARPTVSKSRLVDQHRLGESHSLSMSSDDDESWDKMDWFRVLDIRLVIGIKIEVSLPVAGDMSNPGILFHTNLTIRKPSSGETTIIQGKTPFISVHLLYREFLMLNLVARENIGKPVDASKWDNIEKSYWQNEDESLANASSDQHESSVMYAEGARFVRFGEGNAASKNGRVSLDFGVDHINVTLHR